MRPEVSDSLSEWGPWATNVRVSSRRVDRLDSGHHQLVLDDGEGRGH